MSRALIPKAEGCDPDLARRRAMPAPALQWDPVSSRTRRQPWVWTRQEGWPLLWQHPSAPHDLVARQYRRLERTSHRQAEAASEAPTPGAWQRPQVRAASSPNLHAPDQLGGLLEVPSPPVLERAPKVRCQVHPLALANLPCSDGTQDRIPPHYTMVLL